MACNRAAIGMTLQVHRPREQIEAKLLPLLRHTVQVLRGILWPPTRGALGDLRTKRTTISMMLSRRATTTAGESMSRLKISAKVWRLAVLKKLNALIDMCRSIGSMPAAEHAAFHAALVDRTYCHRWPAR